MEIKSCCRMMFRFMFVIFNVIAALMGFIIIVLGIVSLASSRYLYIANFSWYGVPLFLIIMGLVLFAFTVFGVISAAFDIKFFLFIYSIGLIGCIVLIAVTCIAGFIWKDVLDNGIGEALQANVNQTEVNDLVKEIQQYEKCCGVNNYSDWFTTPWANNKTHDGKGIAVPLSCCKDETRCDHGIAGIALNADDIYTVGCYEKITNYVNEYYYGFIIIILVFCFFLALGEIVTWYLLCSGSSKNQNTYVTV